MTVTTFWKLLGLLSLLLMPFGMASASASTGPEHHSAGASSVSHCGGSSEPDVPAPSQSDCAMNCSIMTAPVIAVCEPLETPRTALKPVMARAFSGIHPETATPPPKPA